MSELGNALDDLAGARIDPRVMILSHVAADLLHAVAGDICGGVRRDLADGGEPHTPELFKLSRSLEPIVESFGIREMAAEQQRVEVRAERGLAVLTTREKAHRPLGLAQSFHEQLKIPVIQRWTRDVIVVVRERNEQIRAVTLCLVDAARRPHLSALQPATDTRTTGENERTSDVADLFERNRPVFPLPRLTRVVAADLEPPATPHRLETHVQLMGAGHLVTELLCGMCLVDTRATEWTHDLPL